MTQPGNLYVTSNWLPGGSRLVDGLQLLISMDGSTDSFTAWRAGLVMPGMEVSGPYDLGIKLVEADDALRTLRRTQLSEGWER